MRHRIVTGAATLARVLGLGRAAVVLGMHRGGHGREVLVDVEGVGAIEELLGDGLASHELEALLRLELLLHDLIPQRVVLRLSSVDHFN